MRLLEKTNPNATLRTVVRRALAQGAIGAFVYFLFFKPGFREFWPVTLPVWVTLCAAIGALFE